MNALAVLEQSHKGPPYFRLKVKGDEGGRFRVRMENKTCGEVKNIEKGMVDVQKDVVFRKRRKHVS